MYRLFFPLHVPAFVTVSSVNFLLGKQAGLSPLCCATGLWQHGKDATGKTNTRLGLFQGLCCTEGRKLTYSGHARSWVQIYLLSLSASSNVLLPCLSLLATTQKILSSSTAPYS